MVITICDGRGGGLVQGNYMNSWQKYLYSGKLVWILMDFDKQVYHLMCEDAFQKSRRVIMRQDGLYVCM